MGNTMKSIVIPLSIMVWFSCKSSNNPIEKARSLIVEKQYSEAISLLNGIIEENPTADSAYLLRGYANYMIGEKAASKRDYNRLLVKPEFKLTALLSRASANFNSMEYDIAATEYSNIIEHYPTSYEAFYGRGMCKTNMPLPGDIPGDLISSFAEDRLVHYDYNGALKDLDEAIRLKPDHAAVYVARGQVYEKQNLNEQALANFNKAITLDPKDYLIYLRRGLLYKSLNESKKAINDFDTAIKLNPKDPFAYSNRGYLKKEQFNDKTGACADFLKAQELGLPMDNEEKDYCK